MSNRMVRLSSILLRPVPHSQSMVNPSKLWPSHDHSPPNLRPMTSDHHTIALTILLNVLYISWYSYVLIVVRSRLLYIMHSIIDHLLILLSSNPLVFSRISNLESFSTERMLVADWTWIRAIHCRIGEWYSHCKCRHIVFAISSLCRCNMRRSIIWCV